VRLDGTPPDGERDLVAGDRRVGRLGLVVADPGGGAAALATLRSDLAEGLTVTVGGRTLLGVERL
jgi:folate-binding Fe-S cluster repair protein YgfZ